MDLKLKISTPRYQQIAADIAAKIVEGKYVVGDKIYARSALATQYGVSSETARRAICILSDLGIADSTKGSGVIIKSYENAIAFVKQYKDIQNINSLKKELIKSVERQKKETEIFTHCLESLLDKTELFRSINPFIPFQLEILKETPHLNESIREMNFWHHTSATIIAVKRKDDLLLSPGPYATLSEHDTLYFIGDDDCMERVRNFLYPNK
ncbi:GntR family transcriptional regulator [Sinanaerobacter sp. ZZT-01]|uniref:GntR family transcriptional regulator n=1 Tax=Sinanaerobacter sp. ZZT-01 TaxID=3111540 RepID=UPI002D77087B|nr:GntR family transcriptional regulator [Sinanaerobacter sp. ZZT-01]WRR94116.1 GntR family transcriptional regulator [Sinanaerobacter sp. ZZT-01]